MMDDSTNEQIAALLQLQTYAERMEMCEWFRDAATDAEPGVMDADWFASMLEMWADNELADDEPTP